MPRRRRRYRFHVAAIGTEPLRVEGHAGDAGLALDGHRGGGLDGVAVRTGEVGFAVGFGGGLAAARVPFPRAAAAGHVVGRAGALVALPLARIDRVLAEADLHVVHVAAAHVDAALRHHGFHLPAGFRRHVLEVLAHVGYLGLLSVDLALALDLPETRLDRRRGLVPRDSVGAADDEDRDQRSENDRAHGMPP